MRAGGGNDGRWVFCQLFHLIWRAEFMYVLRFHKLIKHFLHSLFYISRRSETSVSSTVLITFVFSFKIGNENL